MRLERGQLAGFAGDLSVEGGEAVSKSLLTPLFPAENTRQI